MYGAGMRHRAPISVPHLAVPAAQGLDGAAEHNDVARGIALGGRAVKAAGGCPALLDVVQAQVQADGLGQQGQQGPLLQLVVQDGRVARPSAIIIIMTIVITITIIKFIMTVIKLL